MHIKDPFVFTDADGAVQLFFCSHPFCWSSSNTGRAQRRPDGSFDLAATDFFPRGPAWDVAITRGTCLLDVPRVGLFADEPLLLMFYDGGECVRNMDEHAAAVSRPRGYSCEELGGLAWLPASGLQSPRRISRYWPMFVSPYGTGCSRYVDILSTEEGMYATWQQSQTDGSQPLVMNFVPADEIQQILS